MPIAFSNSSTFIKLPLVPTKCPNSGLSPVRRRRCQPSNHSLSSSSGAVTRNAPTCVWVERSANIIIDDMKPDECFDCYSDLEAMPKWSPWLKKVEVDKADVDVSRWTINTRGLEVSWKARNTKVIRGQIIAWKSESGLSNRGRVLFEDISKDKCKVTLAIEFDVPEVVASAIDNDYVGKYVEETLGADLERFRSVALRYRRQLSVDERRRHSSSTS